MKTADMFRFFFIMAIWLVLVVWILLATKPITLYTIFVVVASGIIILVPLYKKYTKKN